MRSLEIVDTKARPGVLAAPLSEMYVDTIQGEGATVGKLSSFVRFTGCHRSCSWCDSPHTWRKGEISTKRIEINEIVKFLEQGKATNVILTGGEPLLHQDKSYFQTLVNKLFERMFSLEIETEGTFFPTKLLLDAAKLGQLRFNCSPKLKHAGMGDLSSEYSASDSYGQTSLESIYYSRAGIFKFVVQSEDDVKEAFELLKKARLDPQDVTTGSFIRQKIYLMPEGNTRSVQLQKQNEVIDLALKYGVNFSPRLHVLRWDSLRGV